MDNPASDAYLPRMFARAVTMLAILAIAVLATLAPAHAARMSVVPDQAVHVTAMMQSPHGGEASGDGDRHCGSADTGMCEFVCTGLSVLLPSPGSGAGHSCAPVSHDRPSEELHAGFAPGLNERPPKIRLL